MWLASNSHLTICPRDFGPLNLICNLHFSIFNLQFPFLVAWLPFACVRVLRRFAWRNDLKLVRHLLHAISSFSDALSLSPRFSRIDISTQGNRTFDHVDVDISLWRLRVTD